MMKRSFRQMIGGALLSAIIGVPGFANAYLTNIEPVTNIKALRDFAERSRQTFQKEQSEAKRLAALLGIPVRVDNGDGHTKELVRFWLGRPIYYETCNLESAQTVSATAVWPGGSTGLNLTGEGVVLGEWDAGSARTTHQEMDGRSESMDGGALHGHAAHVGGTIIASGIVEAAKGMSFKGFLRSYDWGSDSSEMAAEAAGGLLLSNHSYGSWGDNIFYGMYDGGSAGRDELACDAPYYLICQAAGNSQTSNTKNGYDTLILPASAKNILTVGAINKNPAGYSGPGSVSMSGFSSWGPTDDGRIKPDIVAPGVNLYSTSVDGDDQYTWMSGTSMATPCTTGNLGLIVQYYKQTHSNRAMLSATLKGLVIHTADEAGDDLGPDYRFGWGQLNTESACLFIKDTVTAPDYIQEQTLTQGSTYTYSGNPTGTPVKVTVVWTDPPGTSQGDADDRTPRLVNDLDVRVINNGVTYKPWVLDVEDPTAAATTGDNVLDNVEQVYVPGVLTGTVTVKVTHKGTLKPAGAQNFSIIISGIASTQLSGLVVDPNPIIGGIKTQGRVTINGVAPGSGLWVNLTTDASKSVMKIPTRALIPGGKSTGTFDITTYTVNAPQTASITAEYGVTDSETVTINPPGILSFTLDQLSVVGGETATGQVTIGQSAPTDGALVRLASNLPKAANVDWRLIIPYGETTETFSITTFPVKKATDVTIRAAYPGPTKYVTLRVLPVFAIDKVAPSSLSVKGGNTITGTVTMNGPAKVDTTVTLASSNTLLATVPSTVIVPAGETTATFNITTTVVKSKKSVNISAAYSGKTVSTKLTITK